MAEDKYETNICSDKVKLTQIATVMGDVLIVNEGAVNRALPRSSAVSRDVTDYVKVIVKSNRFGKKVQLQVGRAVENSNIIRFWHEERNEHD